MAPDRTVRVRDLTTSVWFVEDGPPLEGRVIALHFVHADHSLTTQAGVAMSPN